MDHTFDAAGGEGLKAYLEDLQDSSPQLREIWIGSQQHEVLQQRLSHHIHRYAQTPVHPCSMTDNYLRLDCVA